MSFLNDQFHFLKALPIAMSAAELEIPDTPPDAGKNSQGYKMHVGDRYLVYSPGRRKEGHFVVRGWLEAADGHPRRVDLENEHSGSRIRLSTWQVSTLESQGRIKAVSLTRGDGIDSQPSPGLRLLLDENKQKKAERYLGYVHACMACFASENGGKSSKRLALAAIEEHAHSLGEKAPSYTNVWEKFKAYREDGGHDPLFALADKDRPGNRRSKFGPFIEKMIEGAVEAAWRTPNGNWKTVKSVFRDLVEKKRKAGELTDEDARHYTKIISDRTFQRRMYEPNQYDRSRWRWGEDYANREFAQYIRQMLPDFPLDIVDVDHTTFNISVIDDRYPIAYGRPDLLVFRDRKTGVVLGYSLSFNKPSYESFLHGLRHAIFPKDMSAFPGCSWPFYGRMFRMGVDNALHFIGNNINAASRQLDFQLVEYRPGHPWEKGALERLNGILGVDVALGLPGATAANPVERDKFDDPVEMTKPTLTMSELEGFLVDYFDIYHRMPQEGLGILRTLKGIPEVLWEEGIKHTPNRAPIDPNIFVRLAGDRHKCTVQPIGIRLDHIVYQSEELLALTTHPSHKPGEGRHRSTQYDVVRDPNDLGRVWVHDPYRNVMMEIPACSADYSYANGLRLFQHRRIVEYWNKEHGQPKSAAELEKAMDDYQLGLVKFHQLRRKHGTAFKLAQFVGQQARKLARSRIVTAVDSPNASSDWLDVADPVKPAPLEPRSIRAPKTATRQESGGDYTVITQDVQPDGLPVAQDPVPAPAAQPKQHESAALADDIEFLKTKYEGYD